MNDKEIVDPNRAAVPIAATRILPWLAQLLAAVLTPFLGIGILESFFPPESLAGALGNSGYYLLTECMLCVLGLALGVLVGLFSPRLAQSGRSVWVPAVCLLLVCAAVDLLSSQFRWSAVWTDYFVSTPPGYDEAPIIVGLVTAPALSCSAYSVGVVTVLSLHSWRKKGHLRKD